MLILGSVVAQRSLKCKREGKSLEATVYLGCPFEESGSWTCEYGIDFSDISDKYVHKIIGEDSMQALQLAIVMLGNAVANLEGIHDWRWNEEPYVGLPTDVGQPILGNMP